MKVAFISHDAGLYGATRSLLDLIEGLKVYNVECYVIFPGEGPAIEKFREKNIPFAILKHELWVSGYKPKAKLFKHPKIYLRWWFFSLKRLFINMAQLPKFIKQLKKWNIDIIYTNTSVIPIGSLVSMIMKKPHIWHIREFKELDHKLYLDWGNFAFRIMLKRSAAQIVISNALKQYLNSYLIEDKAYVITNGIALKSDFDTLCNRPKKARGERSRTIDNCSKPFTFSMVGFISHNKGQQTAVKAVSLLKDEYPDIKLLIVGRGGHRVLKQLTKDLKIEHMVELWGHINDPYKVYLASDALLMCSANEAFGRVTVEAMSACLPVIGFNNAGTAEIIEHEHTGLLYDGQEKELAKSMKRFIEDPEWARELGENGWRVAKEKYNIERYSQQIHEILKPLQKHKDLL